MRGAVGEAGRSEAGGDRIQLRPLGQPSAFNDGFALVRVSRTDANRRSAHPPDVGGWGGL